MIWKNWLFQSVDVRYVSGVSSKRMQFRFLPKGGVEWMSSKSLMSQPARPVKTRHQRGGKKKHHLLWRMNILGWFVHDKTMQILVSNEESRPTASVHSEASFWSADRQCQHAQHVIIVVKPVRHAPVAKIRLSWSSYKKEFIEDFYVWAGNIKIKVQNSLNVYHKCKNMHMLEMLYLANYIFWLQKNQPRGSSKCPKSSCTFMK